NACDECGKVMDVYMPNKLSKQGKPFAFVRFNKNACDECGKVMDVYMPNKLSKQGKPFAFVWFNKEKLVVVRAKEVTRWVPEFRLDDNFQQQDDMKDDRDNNLFDTESSHVDDVGEEEKLVVVRAKEVTRWVPEFRLDDNFQQQDDMKDDRDNNLFDTKSSHADDVGEEDMNTKEEVEVNMSCNVVGDEIVRCDFGNNSCGHSKQEHVNSLNPSKKPINGFSILKRFHEVISIRKAIEVLQDQIIDIDIKLDKGVGSPVDVADRENAFRSIVEMDQKITINLAQKAKIKRAIEDDVMFLGKWSRENMNVPVMMLNVFFLVFELKINVQKSSLFIFGVRYSTVQIMVHCFGCVVDKFPLTYLGVKISANMSRINSWQEVTQKAREKFSKWKKSVMAEKQYGGLGVSSLFALNRALLFKWIWRFLNSQTGFWKSFIKAIYVPNGSLDEPIPRHSGGSVWVMIRKSIDSLKSKGVDLMWTLNGSGCFSVSSTRKEIDKHLLAMSSSHTRWSKVLPIKVNVFIWPMFLEKLTTCSNLSAKGVDVPGVLFLVCDSEVV
nr:RNA-directed DNA polymerase, eukaryota, reverse transcriptase zinc-binding domain protein [Tanacetum cinerariifolium]